ncbi:carbohydrate binding family 9 domain-containing protein [bacterium]|nr:carbohydrate binding family 9 domain-containing protein [bacterium]
MKSVTNNRFRTMFLALLIMSWAGTSLAIERRVYQTRRTAGSPPVIDGRLDDPVWELVEWSGDFIQRSPHEGKPPSEQTAFKILYDDSFLYVAFRCFDTEPELISKRLSRRDGFDGDWVEINIDSLFDHRTAYSFTASVSGVLGDEYISEDGDNWDTNWDPIWYFETMIDELGWTAEFRIPLSQLRFSSAREQVWGIQCTRRIFRYEERSNWQNIPREETGWVSLFGELHGITGLEPKRQIELLPYGVAQYERFPRERGNPYARGERTEFDAGLDGKLGLSTNFVLDFTINPDFGQIEADPSEVNLTAYETFFDEKRPFFIEGRNILDYCLTTGMWEDNYSSDTLFYSRRIGRAPHRTLSSDAANAYFVDQPDETTILGALKLTGKSRNGLAIGILEGITAAEDARVEIAGQEHHERVEPLTNYFIACIQKDYDQGNTVIGGMFTSTERDLDRDELDFLHRSTLTGGLDLFQRWADQTYYFGGKLFFSQVRGDQEAIYLTQTSSTHYFQRPDADHVNLDPDRTSLTGHGGSLKIGKSSGEGFRFESGLTWRSPGLELNDLGYLRSDDRINAWTWVGYRIIQPFSVFNAFSTNLNGTNQWDFSGEHEWNKLNLNSNAEFKNFWTGSAGLTYQEESLSRSALRGGPSLKVPAGLSAVVSCVTDYHKRLYGEYGFESYQGEYGSSNLANVWFSLCYRPSNALKVTFNPSYVNRADADEYISTIEDSQTENYYIFGKIHQSTLAMTIRLDYTLTRNLTIQYYGQPFISSGSYSHFKRVTDPRAKDYHNRYYQYDSSEITYADRRYSIDENHDGSTDYDFDDPDFNVQLFISNLVVRWEYVPGSTLYVVWSQNREAYLTTGDFAVGDDLDHLFSIQPENIFLVKMNYWLSL